MDDPGSIESFKTDLARLVEAFQKNLSQYRSEAYDESSVRNDFLNPFWRALGWDIENREGLPQSLREVQLETRVQVGGRKKRADYTFRTEGIDRFVCEAKKPREDLSSPRFGYQTQRYAFNLKLLLAILTDFEEIRIFVVGGKPDSTRPFAPYHQWHYSEYLARAQEIWDLLARPNVASNSIDRFISALPKKPIKGMPRQGWRIPPQRRRTVDSEFLAYIENQRTHLAHDLVRENKKYPWTETSLNEAIQRILDRILFVRICEDRDIDTIRPLDRILDDWRRTESDRSPFYPRLVKHFQALDEPFNGALFRKEHLSERVRVSNEFLVSLIEGLSSEDSPYLFSTLPVEILGSVYERFIGKVVRLRKAHRVDVDLKPEVRKAGGVYYTPRYIVDYIVENAVGNLLEGKSPREVSKIRILDPACGSGSFLIRTFERICAHYLRWFHSNPKEQKESLCYRDSQNQLQLTTHVKHRIMLENIYGVDLDAQAVEVTMLSLYLKILEGETRSSLGRQHRLFPHETFLPDLTKNIRQGNSLIENNFFDLFSSHQDRLVIRAFDWNVEFSDVMKSGGFDSVIGNPPYYNIDTLGKNSERMKYLKKRYALIWNDKTDILNYFLFRALSLSKAIVGMIVSRAFLEAYKSNRLRAFILKNCGIQGIVDFSNFRVFQAGITTAIIILDKTASTQSEFTVRKLVSDEADEEHVRRALVSDTRNGVFQHIAAKQANLTADSWNFISSHLRDLYARIDDGHPRLSEVLTVGQGMQTGRNEVFGGLSADDVRRLGLGGHLTRKRAANSDIERYFIRDRGEFLIWTEDVDEFESLSHELQGYLLSRASKLKARAAYRRGNCSWWKFTWPLHKELYSQAKIISPFLSRKNRFAFDSSSEFVGLTDTIVLFRRPQVREDILYFLGLLNSKLLDLRFKGIAKLKSGGIFEYFWNSVSKLPVRLINFSDPLDKARHERMLGLVQRMLELMPSLQNVRSDSERKTVENSVRATDHAIDELVYELYGLSKEDVGHVEEHAAMAA